MPRLLNFLPWKKPVGIGEDQSDPILVCENRKELNVNTALQYCRTLDRKDPGSCLSADPSTNRATQRCDPKASQRAIG